MPGSQKTPLSYGNGMALLVGLTGLALTCLAYTLSLRSEERRQVDQFQRRASTYLKFFEERRAKYESMLLSLRSIVVLGGELSRARFGSAARDLLERHSGVLALEWVPRVLAADRGAVEAKARSEGFPDFQFSERDPSGDLVRGRERSEYFPILFVEPYQGNERALGYEVSDGHTKLERESARDTGLPTMSPMFRLVQREKEISGLAVVLPVYNIWPPPGNIPARREHLRGFVVAIFHVPQLFASVTAEVSMPGIDVLVLDPDAPKPSQVLYTSVGSLTAEVRRPEGELILPEFTGPLSHKADFEIGGRNWVIHFRANSNWIATHTGVASLALLISGVCLSGFLVAGFRASARRESVVAWQVEERTRELQSALALLEQQAGQRKQTDSALIHSRSHLLAAQRLGRIGSWALNLRNDQLVWSTEVYRIFGRNEDSFLPTKENFLELVHPDDAGPLKERARIAIRDCTPYHIEHRILLPDGSIRHVVEHAEVIRGPDGNPAEMIGAVQDITERKRADAERESLHRRIQETQKLESLGVLAGGIAHDFNNLLTGILGNSGLARMDLPPGCGAATALDQIELAARRAADLCFQMLAYAGKGRYSVQPIDLNLLIRDAAPVMSLSIHKSCHLQLNLAPALPSTRGDVNQLRQVIMNLVINASEAITRTEGSITVTTGIERIDSSSLAGLRCAPGLAEGEYVFVEVSDTGCGMATEIMDKIFDPFFTTKFAGRGLGLAASFGMVRRHAGAVKVTSDPGKGSAFKVLLPAVEAKSKILVPATNGSEVSSGTGSVLIIDDEEVVRVFASTVLGQHGFRVVQARNGNEGLDLFRASKGDVRLVLLDLTMPRMGGEEAYLALRDIRSDVRVLIMSGFSEGEVLTRFVGKGVAGFVQKPFDGKELIARVRRALAAPAQPLG